MKVAIVKYNAGNNYSVWIAVNRLRIKPVITDNPEVIKNADRVIFPGVGEAESAMKYLKVHGLDHVIQSLRQPVLGICLGLQLMCAYSEENNTECLHVLPGKVSRFPLGNKVPHIGWNTVTGLKGDLFKGIHEGSYVYFVHSYFVELNDFTTAKTEYIIDFSSAVQKDNFFGCQFHPEKSGDVGAKILRNFLTL